MQWQDWHSGGRDLCSLPRGDTHGGVRVRFCRWRRANRLGLRRGWFGVYGEAEGCAAAPARGGGPVVCATDGAHHGRTLWQPTSARARQSGIPCACPRQRRPITTGRRWTRVTSAAACTCRRPHHVASWPSPPPAQTEDLRRRLARGNDRIGGTCVLQPEARNRVMATARVRATARPRVCVHMADTHGGGR
eukprot:7391577-Prymnesium_polylepis.2